MAIYLFTDERTLTGMRLKDVRWFFLAATFTLGLTAQPAADSDPLPQAPQHPAVGATDASWDRWHEAHATWLDAMDFRMRYAILANDAARPARSPADYDWRLEARFRGLTLGQIQQLAEGGVVATGQTFNLVHAPVKPLERVFVTSDMLLHAYNMMTADFVRGMEMQRAPRFRRCLEAIWPRLSYWAAKYRVPAGRVQAAVAQAQRVIGTALLCLGATVEFKDGAVEQDCFAQRDLVLAASGRALPRWLEPLDDDFVGIDYERMKPVGFYAENETLSRLFRAVRWLQVVPFRPERDTELLAAAIIAETADECGMNADDQRERQWLGLPNSLTVAGQASLSEQIADALRRSSDAPNFESVRIELLKHAPALHANDDVRLDPKLAGKRALPPLLKILPAYLTADSLLFSEVLVRDSDRLPEGRMITAYLGDTTAISELGQAGWNEDVLDAIRVATARRSAAWASEMAAQPGMLPYDDRATFNSMLLHTWAALFLPPADGAPSFLHSAAWHAKSRNTVLAAWAEKKHTWVLHEVEPGGYSGSAGPPPPPPGLVEPNPEFFRRLTFLAEQTVQWMEKNGYLQNGAPTRETMDQAADCLGLARSIHERRLDTAGNPNGIIEWDELFPMGFFRGPALTWFPNEEQRAKLTAADFAELRESAIRSAEAILQGTDPESQPDELKHPAFYRRMRWETFVRCLHSLEAMSEKQLRGEEWSPTEREYLTLGIWQDYYSVVGAGDNGEPPDPKSVGPKIAPVAANPNSHEVLHVGTGDMAEIYVLYPWKGRSFLYRGPIVPYFEIASLKRLNDEDWRGMLKSAAPPRQPRWLAPISPPPSRS